MDRKNGRNMAGPWRRPYNFRPSAPRRMFSSMFHPLPLYTHAPYTRFSPLPRPQFVCINAQPRDRSTPPGNEEAEKPGKFHSAGKRRVPRREGRANFRDTAISTRVFPSPSPGFYGRHDCPQRREGRFSSGGEIVSARALLIFLRGRYSSVPLEEALKRARWSTRFFSSSPFSVLSAEGRLFPWRDRERSSRHAIKGQPETRERFPGRRPCCVHTSLPSIRNSRDHRFRGEQPLRGEDYAISPVTR